MSVDVDAVMARRGESVRWIVDLLRQTASRPAHLGCFGMHEWAMVYRQSPEEIRHADWPLRLSPDDTAAVVDGNRVRCSHFDAYRFFTAAGPATQRADAHPGEPTGARSAGLPAREHGSV